MYRLKVNHLLVCFIISSLFIPAQSLLSQTYKLVGTGRYEGGSVYGMDADGSNPEMWVDFTYARGPYWGSLIEVDGKLWGTTRHGGTHNMGTIYAINTDGTEFTKIHDFNEVNGRAPYSGLTLANGKLWGMTYHGGANDDGAIYYIETDGSGYTKVHDFKGSDPANGNKSAGKLILSNNKLWGMAWSGGVNNYGIIFTIELDGTGFRIVHSFDKTNGRQPYGNNLAEYNGTLFGMTTYGGTNDKGTIFTINNDGTGFSKVHDFDGSNGENPYGSLVVSNGKLWGVTSSGGTSNRGLIFNMDTSGTGFNVVLNLAREPYGDLYEYGGKLYGTTMEGGTSGRGTVYRIDPDGTNFTTLHSFSRPIREVRSSLIFSNGKLWAFEDDLFNLNPDGSDFQIVHDFQPTIGYWPSGRMAESNEKLWGTTHGTGSNNPPAAIFTTNIDGTGFENVHYFSSEYGGDGSDPGPLVAVGDKLWGMCRSGGLGYGTIFHINNDGTGFTKVHDFDSNNGRRPYGTVIESNGKLWGMTSQGGTYGEGVIFTIKMDGTGYSVIHSFDDTHGANPYGELFESGGKLWGLTSHGGTQDQGVIFSIELDGSAFTKHYNINDVPNSNFPFGSFIEANGKLWSTIRNGKIISMNTDGTGLKIEHTLTNGEDLYGNLLHFNNKLWGVTYASQAGTIFTLNDDGTNYTEVMQMDPSFGAQLYLAYGAALIAVDQNHRPTYTQIPDQNYHEDQAGIQIKLTDYFNDMEDGPTGLAYTIENIGTPTLFSSTPITSGVLSLNLAANQFGATEMTVRGTDSGGKYIECTINISIDPVADNPVITGSASVYGVMTTTGLVANRNAVDGEEVTHVRVTDITNGTLYLSNGSAEVANNSFVSFANALEGFKFMPNDVGTSSFNIQSSAGNTPEGLGGSKIQANITVDKKTLTATANNQNRTYGASNPGLTISYSGFVFGENSAVLDSPPTASTAAILTSNTGTYDIDVIGGLDDHYAFSYEKGTLSITKADLSVTADNQNRNYGTANPELTYVYSGFLNGDTKELIDTPPAISTFAGISSDAGEYPILLSGGLDNNYNLILQDGLLTINKLLLTATADNKSRNYGTENPVFTISYSGFLTGETEAVLDIKPIAGTQASSNSPVGNYEITLTTGSDINYDIQHVKGLLTITKATLIAAADDQVRSYGEANPNFTISYTGFIPGDDASLIDNPPQPSTSADLLSSVGNYPITLTAGTDNNYSISLVNGNLTIVKSLLTAVAEDKTRFYGEENPELTIAWTGFRNGDDATDLSLQPALSTTAEATSDAGTYPIELTAGSDDNYDIVIQPGSLVVKKAVLTVRASNATKVYGTDTPEFNLVYSGFLFEDGQADLDVLPQGITVAGKLADVGNYAIEVTGGSDNNYMFYGISGVLTITMAQLTATADDLSLAYGFSDPVFTITYKGLAEGDDASLIDNPPLPSTTVNGTSDPGTYVITLSAGSDNNYMINTVNGTLTITKVILQARADDKSRTYGEENPDLTLTYEGFVNGENESVLDELPLLTTDANTESDAGMYSIYLTGGSDNHYSFERYDGVMTIEQAHQELIFELQDTVFLDAGSIELTATASSGLPVTFSSGNTAIASISGNTLSLLSPGNVVISATQEGNQNYNAAESVARSLTVMNPIGIQEQMDLAVLSVYPNPTRDFFTIQTNQAISGSISIIHASGKVIDIVKYKENAEYDISEYRSEVYNLVIETDD